MFAEESEDCGVSAADVVDVGVDLELEGVDIVLEEADDEVSELSCSCRMQVSME